MPQAELWFDGACSGNPGPMGAGAVVKVAGKSRTLSRALGRGTNNEAEYHGVIEGLKLALEMGARSVVLHGDSQLILRQLEGRYAVRAANLQPFYAQAQALMARFEAVKFEWVPREQNVHADELARAAVEGSRK